MFITKTNSRTLGRENRAEQSDLTTVFEREMDEQASTVEERRTCENSRFPWTRDRLKLGDSRQVDGENGLAALATNRQYESKKDGRSEEVRHAFL